MNDVPLPILLVILDGLADRPYPQLDGRTPLEAARTPVMDRLAAEGQSGFYYPLGPGRIPSTELSHFRLFGYGGYPFPGRACLEALGAGLPHEPGDVFSFLALRRATRQDDGSFLVTGGYAEEFGDAREGYAALDGFEDERSGYQFETSYLSGGEAILRLRQGTSPTPLCGEVTDSDPFSFTGLPVLRPRPLETSSDPEAAARTADALNRFLIRASETFRDGDDLRLVVSKWTGTFAPLPAFEERTGLAGVTVASSRLFGGFADLLGLRFAKEPDDSLAPKLERALECLRDGEGFAHVHTKAADEAAHAGDPAGKVAAIEELDHGLADLLRLPPERLVLCVTSDHCTPVGGRTVHWGDSVPILIRGPYVRADGVKTFGERAATGGSLGQVGAGDILPYLLCQAERGRFLGARPTPLEGFGIPAVGEPWTGTDDV